MELSKKTTIMKLLAQAAKNVRMLLGKRSEMFADSKQGGHRAVLRDNGAGPRNPTQSPFCFFFIDTHGAQLD